jgi:hypothetical protein
MECVLRNIDRLIPEPGEAMRIESRYARDEDLGSPLPEKMPSFVLLALPESAAHMWIDRVVERSTLRDGQMREPALLWYEHQMFPDEDKLVAMSRSADARVRRSVAYLLGRGSRPYNQQVRRCLKRLSHDRDERVRRMTGSFLR